MHFEAYSRLRDGGCKVKSTVQKFTYQWLCTHTHILYILENSVRQCCRSHVFIQLINVSVQMRLCVCICKRIHLPIIHDVYIDIQLYWENILGSTNSPCLSDSFTFLFLIVPISVSFTLIPLPSVLETRAHTCRHTHTYALRGHTCAWCTLLRTFLSLRLILHTPSMQHATIIYGKCKKRRLWKHVGTWGRAQSKVG